MYKIFVKNLTVKNDRWNVHFFLNENFSFEFFGEGMFCLVKISQDSLSPVNFQYLNVTR